MRSQPIERWSRILHTIMATEPRAISAIDFVLPDTTNIGNKPNGGRRNTVAAAKREAIKVKNRKAHKRACR